MIKLLAFLARYGHQQVLHMRDLPTSFLVEISQEIGTIMEEERDRFERQME